MKKMCAILATYNFKLLGNCHLKSDKQKPEKSLLFLSKALLLLGTDASGAAALRDCSTTGLGFGSGALKKNGDEFFVIACT